MLKLSRGNPLPLCFQRVYTLTVFSSVSTEMPVQHFFQRNVFLLQETLPPSLISPLKTLRHATFTQPPRRPFSLSFPSEARPLHRHVGTPCPHPVVPYLTDSISRPLQRPCSCAENQPWILKSPRAMPLLQPCQRLSLESPCTALIPAGAPGTPSLHSFPPRRPPSPSFVSASRPDH